LSTLLFTFLEANDNSGNRDSHHQRTLITIQTGYNKERRRVDPLDIEERAKQARFPGVGNIPSKRLIVPDTFSVDV
jgi:hypothetical protein